MKVRALVEDFDASSIIQTQDYEQWGEAQIRQARGAIGRFSE